MPLKLPPQVRPCGNHVIARERAGVVAPTPTDTLCIEACGIDAPCRLGLRLAEKVRKRYIRSVADQHMHMIGQDSLRVNVDA